ncbi:MAG: extracellular solute-binding protein, partial [Candidatus Njordarchaeales archaeon]
SDSVVKDKVDFKRVPYFSGFEDTRTTCLGGFDLCINTYSKHKEEAWDLIKFMTSYDSQLETAVVCAQLPTRKAVYNDPELTKKFPKALQQYNDYLVGDVRPSAGAGAKYSEVSDIMQTAIHAALSKVKAPSNSLKEAAEKINSLIQKK